MSSKHNNYTANEKAIIALEALKGNLTYAQISSKYKVHVTQIIRWKQQLKDNIADIFNKNNSKDDIEEEQLIGDLYKQIGQLTVERDWLKKNLNCSNENKKLLIEPNHDKLSIHQQCRLLGINRANYYYKSRVIDIETLNIMNKIDEIYTQYPFYGTRRMTICLQC